MQDSKEQYKAWIYFLNALKIKAISVEDVGVDYDIFSDIGDLPDFWLPSYNGGIFLKIVSEDIKWVPDRQYLETINHSLWLVVGKPQAKVSYLYFLNEDGFATYIPVIPGFDTAFKQGRLFINPTCIDSKGYIKPSAMKTSGKKLQEALDAVQTYLDSLKVPVKDPTEPSVIYTQPLIRVDNYEDDPIIQVASVELMTKKYVSIYVRASGKIVVDVVGTNDKG